MPMVPSPGGASWALWGYGDAPGVYFYKLENGVLVRQTFPGAHLVEVDIDARADVLWNDHDLHLFVLMYKGEDTTLHKYSYDASTQTYTLLAGFPVAIPLLAGSESATITQDSTGDCGLPMIQRSVLPYRRSARQTLTKMILMPKSMRCGR